MKSRWNEREQLSPALHPAIILSFLKDTESSCLCSLSLYSFMIKRKARARGSRGVFSELDVYGPFFVLDTGTYFCLFA